MKMKKEGVLVLSLLLLIALLIIPLSYSAPTRQCNDGLDNDGNGCADYSPGNPTDTGCTSGTDDNESGGLCACSSLSGTCCSSGQLCSGGSFSACTDCDSLCCIGGSCTNPTHLECSGRSCVSVAGAGSNLCSIDSDCYSCGDAVCDSDESCSNCSADCGCSVNQICVSNSCIAVSYCGDGVCDANESCSNCSADCGCSATQCCSVGSANANVKGCVNSGKVTTTGNVCCSGTGYSGECCTDSECYSPNVCNTSVHTCGSPYNPPACTAANCLCDLSLILLSINAFNAGSSQSYYVSIKDLNNNYTGTSTITNSIENSTGYITSYGLTNYTFSMNENKTMAYSPAQRCGNTTNTIKVKIANFGCNDSASSNNEASKSITIVGGSICPVTTATTTTTTTEESEEETIVTPKVSYSIEVPQKIEISTGESTGSTMTEQSFTLKVNLDNQKDDTEEFEVWSYVYLDDICYSCYNGNTETSNKKNILVEAGSSKEIALENLVNISEPGNYKVKVLILESGSAVPEEFVYDLEVAGASEVVTGQSIEEQKTEDTYELKSKKIKIISFVLFMALILGTAGFFGYKNKESIIEFINEKKREFERKRSWKEHIETRRGKGILKRLSTGFLKKSEDGRK